MRSSLDRDMTTASPSRAPSEMTSEGKKEVVEDAHTKAETPLEPEVQGPNILPASKFLPIYVGLLLTIFLISLDNTVISTAQVPIVEHLGGENLILWIPTAFLLAQASFTLFFGQVLQIFSSKYTYLVSLFIFELGSLVCALAPTMPALIVGRAVAGIGAAGLFMAAFQIMIESTSVAARAGYIALIGAVFSISMIVAPSIGGALSQHVSWRWCFWINLPCAVVAAAGVVFLFKSSKPLGTPLHSTISFYEKMLQLDVVGVILTAGFMVMILVPLQDAASIQGSARWHDASVLAPLCCSILVLPLMWVWFRYKGESKALIPLTLLRDKNLLGCAITSFFGYWEAIAFIYMLPFYFQTVRGSSPTNAGVEMLAMMITLAITSLVCGILSKKFGHYFPYMPPATIVGMVGAGICYTMTPSSSTGFRIGTQILLGLSFGPIIQTPMIATQANVKDKKLIAKATAIVSTAQRLGGGIGTSVASAILYAQLPVQIQKRLPTGTPYSNANPTTIYGMPNGTIRDAYVAGLSKTIDIVFLSAVPAYFFALIAVLFLVKITDIRSGQETKKIDLFRRLVGSKKTADPDAAVA